jgi:hypothetical protein
MLAKVALVRAGQGKGAVDWLRSAGKIEMVSDELGLAAGRWAIQH